MSLDKKIAQILYKDETINVDNFGDINEKPTQISEVVETGNSKLRVATHKFDNDVKYLGKKIDRLDFLDPLNHDPNKTIFEFRPNDQLNLDFHELTYSDDNSKDQSSYEDKKEFIDNCVEEDNISSVEEYLVDNAKINFNDFDSNKQHEFSDDLMNDISDGNKEHGGAIQFQFELYDSLLICRMLEQEILMEANKFPEPSKYNQITVTLGDDYNQQLRKTKRKVQLLLSELLYLQKIHLDIYNRNNASSDPYDDEITSEEDDICMDDNQQMTIHFYDIENTLKLRHSNFEKFRNNILLEAFNRVNSFTSILNKNLNSSSNILTQIKQTMLDKTRLIERTHVHRSMCKILGKNEEIHLVNPQIFDDGDFYHQLLIEMTKRKTSNLKDMMAISRHWSEISKLKKIRKNIDPKASKGRRTRYTVHKKLVNFMPPLPSTCLWSDSQRDGLFQELFKNQKLNDNTTSWMFR